MTALELLKSDKDLLKRFKKTKAVSCDFETLTEKNAIKLNRYKGDPGISDVYTWGMVNDDEDFIWGTTISDFLETVFFLIENNHTHYIKKPGKKSVNYQSNKIFWFVNLPFDYSFMKNELYKMAKRYDGDFDGFTDFCKDNQDGNAYMITGGGQKIIQVKLFIKGKSGKIKCIKELTKMSVKKMGEEIGLDKLTPVEDEDKFYDTVDKVYSRQDLYEKIYGLKDYDTKPFQAEYGSSDNKYLNLLLPYLKNDCLIPIRYFNTKFKKMFYDLNKVFNDNGAVKPKGKFNKVMDVKKSITAAGLSINGFKNYYGRDQYDEEFKGVLTIEQHYLLDKAYQGGLSSFNPVNKTKKGKVIGIDINSSYPYEMMKPLPYGYPLSEKPEGLSAEFINITVKSFKSKFNNQHIPLIKLTRAQSTIPSDLRYVYEYNKKPFNTTYIKEELELIEKYYDIDYKVEEKIWFKMKPYTKMFLSVAKDLKLNAKNIDQKKSAKIVLNALYGKFGEKVHLETKRSVDLLDKQAVKEELEFLKENCGKISYINHYGKMVEMISHTKDLDLRELLTKKKPFSKHEWAGITFLRIDRTAFEYEYHRKITLDDVKTRHIGAYICWKGREHLVNTIELFPWDNIKYYDTDSVYFLGDEVPDELHVDAKEFGAWSIDCVLKYFKAISAKNYQKTFEDGEVKTICAGVHNADKIFNDPNNKFEIGTTLTGVSLKARRLDNGIILTKQDHKISEGDH